MQTKDKQTVRFSFRVTLFSLMLAVLLTAVLLLCTAALFYARYAAGNLGGQILSQAEKRVEQQLLHALDLAEDEAETISGLISSGWFDPADHQRVSEYFLEALRARPSLSYLSFGMRDGTYYHGSRDDDGSLGVLWLIPQSDGTRRLHEFSVSPDGRRETIHEIADSTRTPPYERPYYRAAVEAGNAVWTESYVFLGSGEKLDIPGVSRAVPVFAPDSELLLGVLTADFDLHALSAFLGEMDLGEGGLCFLTELADDGSPRVIAHPAAVDPDPEARLKLMEPAPDGDGLVMMHAGQVADARVLKALSSFDRDLPKVLPTLEIMDIEVAGVSYTGGFRHLGRVGGPDWIICMLLPDDQIFGDVYRMARLMFLMGLGGVVVAGLLSMALSRRVASTLGIIAGETREIGRFRLGAKAPVKSRIKEVRTLAVAVEEMKTGLRSFQKYVPAELVRTLVESGQEAELGGERRELTVYFSDIVGFTSISEQLPPEKLVEILSRYLEEMAREVLGNSGTVDKYIGDAIMAFWGAPRPSDTHAYAACRTALANQDRLRELRAEWRRNGLPELRARIGLHTGSATVGNFGSPDRLDYTAIGDTVNVASRLEGLNRIYGTDILISGATRAAAGDMMVTRPIDRVAVKGRESGILVYELLGEAASIPGETIIWRDRHAAAFELYLQREWVPAREGFESVLDMKAGDVAACLMRARCESILAAPPEDGWDGIFHAPK